MTAITMTKQQIADTLDQIAQNKLYCAYALKLAESFKCITANDLACLRRYQYGTQRSTDHVTLQTIANQIRLSELVKQR